MEESLQKNIRSIEAFLFYYGDPVSRKKIAEFLKISEEEVQNALSSYEKYLCDSTMRGLTLIMNGESVQLSLKKEFSEMGKKFIEEEFRESLTPAGLETVSLIAYLGPVSRATIDYIRGVNSSFTIRNLMMRGLIERSEEKGARYQYRVSFEFLSHMGLSKLEDLPDYEKYRDALRQVEPPQNI